jgi:hypothetical protein
MKDIDLFKREPFGELNLPGQRNNRYTKQLHEHMGTFLKELTLSGFRVLEPRVFWAYDSSVLYITDGHLEVRLHPVYHGEHWELRWSRGVPDSEGILCEDLREVEARIGEIVRGDL